MDFLLIGIKGARVDFIWSLLSSTLNHEETVQLETNASHCPKASNPSPKSENP